ncbi:MAG: oligosaccharide repeat unit polymerase [Selenomonadales bacterium]|nr:oligosaccharide repeat unit polymerase [Selenomonadales bacterium]
MMENINLLPLLTILIALSTVNFCIFFYFDLLQPTVSFFSVMTISLFLGVLNIKRWNLFVSSETSLIVIFGMLAFAGGAVFAHYCSCKKKAADINTLNRIKLGAYDIPWQFIFLCTIVVLILAYFSFREMYDLSVQLGNHEGVRNMIKTLRFPLEQGKIHFSRMNSYRNMISMVIATSFLYFFINNLVAEKKIVLKHFLLVLPIIAVFPFFVMSTGRRSIVHFIICGIVLASIILQQKNGATHKTRMKIVKLLAIAGVIAVGIYFAMGFLTGKVSVGGRDPLTIISHYGGLSVPALEQYITSVHSENQYIMQNTMMGVYGNLNSLGFHLESGKDFLPFVSFQGTDSITTNVYTVFYRLLADYSIPGLLLIMFLFGAILTYSYDYLKYTDAPGMLAVYAYFGYIPFFLFIDDQFMGLFRTRTIYFVIILVAFIYVLRKRYFHLDLKNDAS